MKRKIRDYPREKGSRSRGRGRCVRGPLSLGKED